jgi:hypothetical protein
MQRRRLLNCICARENSHCRWPKHLCLITDPGRIFESLPVQLKRPQIESYRQWNQLSSKTYKSWRRSQSRNAQTWACPSFGCQQCLSSDFGRTSVERLFCEKQNASRSSQTCCRLEMAYQGIVRAPVYGYIRPWQALHHYHVSYPRNDGDNFNFHDLHENKI